MYTAISPAECMVCWSWISVQCAVGGHDTIHVCVSFSLTAQILCYKYISMHCWLHEVSCALHWLYMSHSGSLHNSVLHSTSTCFFSPFITLFLLFYHFSITFTSHITLPILILPVWVYFLKPWFRDLHPSYLMYKETACPLQSLHAPKFQSSLQHFAHSTLNQVCQIMIAVLNGPFHSLCCPLKIYIWFFFCRLTLMNLWSSTDSV